MAAPAIPDILAAVGRTPLVRASRLVPGAELWLKLECANPGLSIHDRVARAAVLGAEELGRLPRGGGGWLVEPADTVAALSLAMVAAARGHTLHAFVPTDAPFEIQETLRLYGARVNPVEPGRALSQAKLFQRQRPGASVMPALYEASGHAAVHERETAPELFADLAEAAVALDALVVPVLSGASLLGLARAFKRSSPATKIVAAAGPAAADEAALPDRAHTMRAVLRPSFPLGPVPRDARPLCDRVELVDEEAAWEGKRALAREEGVLASPTGGAAVQVARVLARELPRGARIGVLIPDSGERWFTTEEARGRT